MPGFRWHFDQFNNLYSEFVFSGTMRNISWEETSSLWSLSGVHTCDEMGKKSMDWVKARL